MSDKPEVIESTNLALGTLDVRDASAQGLALMRERVENQKKMLKIAISLTSPSQWVVFSGTNSSGKFCENLYPTGGAADTILRRAFGLTWGEKTITVEDTPDGRLATASAWLMHGGERREHFTGYRLMGGYIKTEADLRRAVLENLKSVALRDLLGLRFRTPAELKEMGLDVSKVESRAEFQSHDKDPDTVVVPFGKNKGQPITDLDDASLKWLGDAVRKSVEDPAKAKWKGKNQALLDALIAEHKRRRAPAEKPATEAQPEPEKQEKTSSEFDYGPPPMSPDEAKEALDAARERQPGED